MTPIRLIIAGTRTFSDYELLKSWVQQVSSPILEIVSGCAAGADKLGERYAIEHGIPLKLFPADWAKNGKAAGPIRNAQMAEYADCALIFWNGKSKGSSNIILQMVERGKRHYVVSI